MENFEKQPNQLRLPESKEEPKNLLLEGPELVSPEEERKQEGKMSFSFFLTQGDIILAIKTAGRFL
jgi:hypothetical protein